MTIRTFIEIVVCCLAVVTFAAHLDLLKRVNWIEENVKELQSLLLAHIDARLKALKSISMDLGGNDLEDLLSILGLTDNDNEVETEESETPVESAGDNESNSV